MTAVRSLSGNINNAFEDIDAIEKASWQDQEAVDSSAIEGGRVMDFLRPIHRQDGQGRRDDGRQCAEILTRQTDVAEGSSKCCAQRQLLPQGGDYFKASLFLFTATWVLVGHMYRGRRLR